MTHYHDFDRIDTEKLNEALSAWGKDMAAWFAHVNENLTHAFQGAFGQWDSADGLKLRMEAAKLGMDTRDLTDTELALKVGDALTPFLEIMREIAATDEFKQWQSAREYQQYWTEMHGEGDE